MFMLPVVEYGLDIFWNHPLSSKLCFQVKYVQNVQVFKSSPNSNM